MPCVDIGGKEDKCPDKRAVKRERRSGSNSLAGRENSSSNFGIHLVHDSKREQIIHSVDSMRPELNVTSKFNPSVGEAVRGLRSNCYGVLCLT